jgi:N-acetylglucosaminyl-diphospho-decaprenol L-rhamnosyltransferase
MKRLGVAIVTYNSAETIAACLDSLANTGAQIVVVDNASQDETLEVVGRRPNVRRLANPWNRGFAAAANQAFDLLECEYVLLLNPDAEVRSGLDRMVEACAQPGVAAVGGRLEDEAGRAQAGFMVRRLPTPAALALETLGVNAVWRGNPVNRRYRAADLDPAASGEVEQPAGAFLLIRREAWQALGGFDERFEPLWFEDVDFCRRARAAGYRIRYEPAATARHAGGGSLIQVPQQARETYWYGNLLRYAAKHFSHLALLGLCLAVMLGSFVRMVWGIVRSGSPQALRVYGRVIHLAGSCLVYGYGRSGRLYSVAAVGRHGFR